MVSTRKIHCWKELKAYIEDRDLVKNKETNMLPDIGIITDLSKVDGRYFRGHSEEKYKLESTLEREIKKRFEHINDYKLKRSFFDRIVDEYLKDCKKKLKGKISEQWILLDKKYDDEIWAMGQHYGLKTPLLDWSKSFLVALYFAFEPYSSESDYRVIYEINDFMDSNIEIIRSKIDIGGRLSAQKGVFTNLLSQEFYELNKAHYEDRKNCSHYKPFLSKILIHKDLRVDVMEYLLSLNIDGFTIFPDIQGAIMN
ncbi:hypothetical protein BKG96_09460, partial [Rodentibacter caecimuris]